MVKSKRAGLGRGFDSLLGDLGRNVLEQPEGEILRKIDIQQIRPGKYQPRKRFNDIDLAELAQSIAEHGILQPLVVRPVGHEIYEIIAGERRFRAGQSIGLTQLPCVVKHYTDQQALAIALIENLQRSDLNALEIATALQQLIKDFRLTHEKAAQLVGRSRSSVTNILRLLDLNESVQDALRNGEIEMGHARAMHSLSDSQQQMVLAETIKHQYSVRQIENRVRQLHKNQISPIITATVSENVDIQALETRLSDFFGHQVIIKHGGRGQGKVVLKYGNLDELDDILSKWGFRDIE